MLRACDAQRHFDRGLKGAAWAKGEDVGRVCGAHRRLGAVRHRLFVSQIQKEGRVRRDEGVRRVARAVQGEIGAHCDRELLLQRGIRRGDRRSREGDTRARILCRHGRGVARVYARSEGQRRGIEDLDVGCDE